MRRHFRQIGADIALVIGADPFQTAYRHGLFFGSHPATGRFAWPIAGTPENAREYVGIPVQHVGFGVTLLGDKPNVFRHRRVRRTRPLAVDDFVEVVGVEYVGRLHNLPSRVATRGALYTVGVAGTSIPRQVLSVPDEDRKTKNQ